MKFMLLLAIIVSKLTYATITTGDLHLDRDLYVTANESMRNGYVANYNDIKMPELMSKISLITAGKYPAKIECREKNKNNILCFSAIDKLSPAGKIAFYVTTKNSNNGTIYFTNVKDQHSNLRLSGFIKVLKSSNESLVESIMNVSSANIQIEAQVFAVEEMAARFFNKQTLSPYLIGELNF